MFSKGLRNSCMTRITKKKFLKTFTPQAISSIKDLEMRVLTQQICDVYNIDTYKRLRIAYTMFFCLRFFGRKV
jgi:hypothetical protein